MSIAGSAGASPITYIEQVTASGSLGTSAFTHALVTLTLNGDTDNVHVNSGSGAIVNSTGVIGTIDVQGIGTATFTTPSKR